MGFTTEELYKIREALLTQWSEYSDAKAEELADRVWEEIEKRQTEH